MTVGGGMFGWVRAYVLCLVAALGSSGCKTDAGCRSEPGCKEIGACSAKLYYCTVGSSGDCALSKACTRDGRCAAINAERGLNCAPQSNANCVSSTGCLERGNCWLNPRSSVAGGNAPECQPRFPVDCERSVGCRDFNRCKLEWKSNGDAVCTAGP